LADSLPQQVVQQLKHERGTILDQARAANRPLSWQEEQQLWLWYSEKVESYLDAGRGHCWLRHPSVAKLVSNAIKFFHGERYTLRAWVVMPNHAHAVLHPIANHSLSTILHSWKSFTAKKANRILKREGEWFWQKESYDHWIRDDDEHARLVRYVENNPVQANLCRRAEDWPWSSAHDRAVEAGILPASEEVSRLD
jgi:REP element-mobilizing transposase RayT